MIIMLKCSKRTYSREKIHVESFHTIIIKPLHPPSYPRIEEINDVPQGTGDTTY